jgi:hypothetical protein
LAISEDNKDRERLENNALMQDRIKELEEEKQYEADKNAELERKVKEVKGYSLLEESD